MVKISRHSSNSRKSLVAKDSWCRAFLKLFCLTQGVHLAYRIYRYETSSNLPPTPMSDLLHTRQRQATTVHDLHRNDYQQSSSANNKERKTDASKTKGKTTTTDTTLTKHGSGPAKLGYVVDLLQERTSQSFRKLPLTLEASFQQSKNCDYVDATTKRRLLTHSQCRESITPLTAVNRASFARYLCGNKLEPGASMTVPKTCDLDATYSVHPPPTTPVVVMPKQSDSKPLTLESLSDCPVPCQFDSSLLPSTKLEHNAETQMFHLMVDHQWELRLSKQDPYYVAAARRERTDYRRDIYYSTTSLQSDLPLSFFNFDSYDLQHTRAVDWETTTTKNVATYLQNSDCSAGRRHKWLAAVQAVLGVECFGKCSHNTELPSTVASLDTLADRLALMKRNRIVLAFEGGTEKDHITSIVWEALLSGSVPAIVGPPNVEAHLPKNSAIFNANFNNWDKFAEYVKKVSEDKELWNTYHEWRSDPTEWSKLQARMEFTSIPTACRICTWAHAKRYGLGWNHTRQSMVDLHIPRQLCLSSSNVITQPFLEIWNDNVPDASGESCSAESVVSSTTTVDGVLDRKVVFRDGITDMVLSNMAKDAVLTLQFDVHNTEGAYFRDTHTVIAHNLKRTAAVSSATVQDDKVKITVLANWEVQIHSPAEGKLQLTVQADAHPDETRKIRVIAEDVNELHDKLTEFYPSSFGSLMMKDFVDPLEFYFDA